MDQEQIAVKDVVVLRGLDDALDDEEIGALGGQVARETGCLVVALADGQSLEALDEDEMREHGWVRA